MQEEELIQVERAPGQRTESVVTLFGYRIQGNAVYLFMAGCFVGCMAFVPILLSVGFGYAVMVAVIPPALSVFFVKKFMTNKPSRYFRFWLDEVCNGPVIRLRPKSRGSKLGSLIGFFRG